MDILDHVDRTLVRLFEAGPGGEHRRRERLARFGACTAISLTGVALVLPNLAPYLTSGQPAVGLGLGALTFETDGERTVVRLAHDRAEAPVAATSEASTATAT